MKKVLTLVTIAGMFTLVACGPSAEEIAKKEKAKQDSILTEETAKAATDSTAKYEEEMKEKMTADSIAKHEAAHPAKGAKATAAPKATEKPAEKPKEVPKEAPKARDGKK